jgi:hypothetical protein
VHAHLQQNGVVLRERHQTPNRFLLKPIRGEFVYLQLQNGVASMSGVGKVGLRAKSGLTALRNRPTVTY